MPDKPTILLTGIPRSGTTLCCNLLNRVPNTVALHEPIASEKFRSQSSESAIETITAFVLSSRHEVLSSGSIQSKQVKGVVPTNPVIDGDTDLRAEQVSPGTIDIHKPLTEDFRLVIKHNALFTALLPQLTQEYFCFAIVRNPLATLASWQTVDLPIHDGHIPMGEQFDISLQSKLKEINNVLDRQLYILRWFYDSFASHLSTASILRYEDIVVTNGIALSALADEKIEPLSGLENQNANKRYPALDIDMLLGRLLQESECFKSFYSPTDLEILADEIRAL